MAERITMEKLGTSLVDKREGTVNVPLQWPCDVQMDFDLGFQMSSAQGIRCECFSLPKQMKLSKRREVNAKPLRILQVAPTLGAHGGIESLSLAIARAVKGCGMEIRTIFRLRTGRLHPSLHALMSGAGVPAEVMRFPDFRFWRAIIGAEIVHCHYPIPWVVFPALALGKTIVLTVENQRQPKSAALMALERHALRFSHRCVFISQFVAKTWLGEAAAEQALIVPAMTHFVPREVSSEKRRGFICISRLTPQKGVVELIDSYGAAQIDRDKHPLTVVGTGPLERQVRQASEKVGNAVRVTGYVDEDRKVGLLAGSRWNVAPQTFAEDQGLTPLEARMCGVPSIVSDIGGLPEAGGPGAIKCEAGNVAALAQALEVAEAMGSAEYEQRCRANADDLQVYCQPMTRYAEVYEEALTRSRRSLT